MLLFICLSVVCDLLGQSPLREWYQRYLGCFEGALNPGKGVFEPQHINFDVN